MLPRALLARLVSVALMILLPSACSEPIDPAAPPFRAISYEQALVEASKDGRLVFLDFYADWCPPCRRLDATTWKDPQVIAWLEQHAVPLKIDAERWTDLAARFEVEAYPTLIFVDASGREKLRLLGYRDAARFLAESAPLLGAGGASPSPR